MSNLVPKIIISENNKDYAESSKTKNKTVPVFNWEIVKSNFANQP